jgi:hypothetical protein
MGSKLLPTRKLQVLEFAAERSHFRPVELRAFYPTQRAAYVHVKKLQRQGLLCRTRMLEGIAYRISARGVERLKYLRSVFGISSSKPGSSGPVLTSIDELTGQACGLLAAHHERGLAALCVIGSRTL